MLVFIVGMKWICLRCLDCQVKSRKVATIFRGSGYGFETGFDGIRTFVMGNVLQTKCKRSTSCVIFVGRYSKITASYFCPKDAISASISLSLATSS